MVGHSPRKMMYSWRVDPGEQGLERCSGQRHALVDRISHRPVILIPRRHGAADAAVAAAVAMKDTVAIAAA